MIGLVVRRFLLVVALLIAVVWVKSGYAESDARELSGVVRTGSEAVRGAEVTLYEAGRRTDGEDVRALGWTQTDAAGRFAVRYRKPINPNAVLYLIADGKQSRRSYRARRPTTSPVRLAAVIGEQPYPHRITINERTTVAAAYAMAQFIDGRLIGGPTPGMPNAAATVRNLVDIETGGIGETLGSEPNGTETTALATVNSLANILAACVRATINCPRLFDLATPPSGDAPRNTLDAIVNIAHFPGQNVSDLLALSELQPIYGPALDENAPTEPEGEGFVNSFVLALRYIGGDINHQVLDGPGNIAFDRFGNAWINNNYAYATDPKQPVCGSTKVIELTPTGKYAHGSPFGGNDQTQDGVGAGGLYGAGFGIGIDTKDNVWITNFGFQGQSLNPLTTLCPNDAAKLSNSVSEFDSNGKPLSPDGDPSLNLAGGFHGPGAMLQPQGVRSDREGDVWVAGCIDGTVTRFRGGNPYDANYLNAQTKGLNFDKAFDVAFDGRGHAFVTGNGSSTVLEISEAFFKVVGDPIGGFDFPMGIASDSAGNLWVADAGLTNPPCPPAAGADPTATIGVDGSTNLRAGVSLITQKHGKPVVTSFPRLPGKRTGLRWPWGIAVDGNDNVWVANFAGQRIAELCGVKKDSCPPGVASGDTISPDSGWYSDALTRVTGIAIDPSGNVWMANNWLLDAFRNPENPGGHQVVVFIGIAGPVATPLIGPPRQPRR